MKPFSIRVNRIVDAGTIVSLIGIDADTGRPVTVHVDNRPYDIVWSAWRDARMAQPIDYAAEGLTLSLGLPSDTAEVAPKGRTVAGDQGQLNRFCAALRIVDPGTSDPSGIAQAIVAACAEVSREARLSAHDPAVRLMVTQLAWVCNVGLNISDLTQLLIECRRRVAAETAL
jgi:hypothetical protein